MLGFVKGKVYLIFPENERLSYVTLIPNNSGVGYTLLVSSSALKRLNIKEGDEASFLVYTYVTPKEVYSLGISDKTRYRLFLRLIRFTGVGPKLAMLVVEHFDSVEEIFDVIASHDVKRLADVPGLGKKKASRILLNFLDSSEVSEFISSLKEASYASSEEQKVLDTLAELLISLGLTKKTAMQRISAHIDEIREYLSSTKQIDVKELLKIVTRKKV